MQSETNIVQKLKFAPGVNIPEVAKLTWSKTSSTSWRIRYGRRGDREERGHRGDSGHRRKGGHSFKTLSY